MVRDDLATWQRLNVTAFLISGITADAGATKLRTVRERADRRGVTLAIYTNEMFATGNDDDNRAAVLAVATDELDIVGVALRAPHRDADAVLRGLDRHP